MPNLYENPHTKALTEGDQVVYDPQYSEIFVKVGYEEAQIDSVAPVIRNPYRLTTKNTLSPIESVEDNKR
jgi:hypothetical protein